MNGIATQSLEGEETFSVAQRTYQLTSLRLEARGFHYPRKRPYLFIAKFEIFVVS